ncbi:unnamed protein product [Linum trigynum]|uniref:Retrotransposon Copia-like N-terminal domain-containing protein n=1 Tax=Linum trigynum TaxID=586398 RepID=A0AAV2DVS1_9ROSI
MAGAQEDNTSSTTQAAATVASTQQTQCQAVDPYYINPNENLSQGIISVKLDGTNYHASSRSMRIALKTKKKLGFINDTLPMPQPTDDDYEIWDQSNTNVMGWILNSLIDPIAKAVMDNETAQDLWKDLQERYGEAY